MQTGYYAATGGMVAQFNRMDTIASNLANVNTAGFKKDNLIMGDFERIYKIAQDELPIKNHTYEAASYFNRTMNRVPHVVDAFIDFSQGNIQQTGNALDLALSKEENFFVVKTPAGNRLTRDGLFTLNNDGVLVNKRGHEVLSSDGTPIRFNSEDAIVVIDKDGTISTNVPDTLQMAPNQQIMVVSPENRRMLTKEGENNYIADPLDALIPITDSGSVMQGYVEKSNVNPVHEMVALIEANRLVGMYQKAMDSQMNDLNLCTIW